MDIITIPTEEVVQEQLSLKSNKKRVVKKIYEAPESKLSENIQKFDKKVRVYTRNPFDYNTISLRKKVVDVPPTQTATQMLTNPTYNSIGKFLGVDAVHDWNKYYDRVFTITEWAKDKGGAKDVASILSWLNKQSRSLPNVGTKTIDNLYLFAKLYFNKKK